jgi:hypothetical protein
MVGRAKPAVLYAGVASDASAQLVVVLTGKSAAHFSRVKG